MIVADSDVLIDALHGCEPVAGRIAIEIGRGTLATTSISSFELLSGAKQKPHLDQVEKLLSALTIVPCDEGASAVAAEIRRSLEASGNKIGMADYLIAGICLMHSSVLWTRNLKHFGRIPGLRLEDLNSDG